MVAMMRLRTVQVIATAVTCFALADVAPADAGVARKRSRRSVRSATTGTRPAPKRAAANKTPTLPCGDYLGFQVAHDREGFSPGQIDGRPAPTSTTRLLPCSPHASSTASGKPDCETWRALNGESVEAALTTYTVTEEISTGPFEKQIPKSLADQAKLDFARLSVTDRELAERFHTSPALLQQLNPGPLTVGREIRVPAVTPFDADAKPAAPRPATSRFR